MNRLLALVGITLLPLLTCAEALEGGIPPPFSATYGLTHGNIPVGVAEVYFETTPDGRYLYRTHTRPSAMLAIFRDDEIMESSEGTVAGGRLRPDHYRYGHLREEDPKFVELRFDWENGRVQHFEKEGNWSMAVPENALDKLVLQLALMGDLARGMTHVEYQVADGGKLKLYEYTVAGNETLTVDGTAYETLRVTRSKQRKPPNLTIWVAPAIHFLPVRIEKQRDSGSVQMNLKSVGPPEPNSPGDTQTTGR